MPTFHQCEAEMYDPHSDSTTQCLNVAAARVTTDEEENLYCRAHTNLHQEFVEQARRSAIRWSSVIQIGTPSGR